MNKSLKEKVNDEENKNLKLENFKDNVLKHLNDITENPDLMDDLSYEELLELYKAKNPYAHTITGNVKYVTLSFTNARENYEYKRALMTFLGFLYRAVDEHKLTEEDIPEIIKNIDESKFMMESVSNDAKDPEYMRIKEEELYVKYKIEFMKQNKQEDYKAYEKKYFYTEEERKKMEDLDYEVTNKEYSKFTSEEKQKINSITNIKEQEKFKIKLKIVKMKLARTQEMIKYIKQFELSQDDEIAINTVVKRELDKIIDKKMVVDHVKLLAHKKKLIEKEEERDRQGIMRFLDTHFTYNPDIHVKSAHNSNIAKEDPTREKIEPSNLPLEEMTERELFHTKIPSANTFDSLKLYGEVNFETIRKEIKNIYGLIPDLEAAINVYGVFNTEKEASDFVSKNRDLVISDILTVTTNNWTFLGPFKENRKRVEYLNENNQILGGMLKQVEEDARIGDALIKKKVKTKKKQNIKEVGPDHPKFKEYKKEMSGTMKNTYTNEDEEKPALIVEETIVDEDGNEVDEDGCPKNAIEVGIINVNVAEGKLEKTKMYSKAVKQDGTEY